MFESAWALPVDCLTLTILVSEAQATGPSIFSVEGVECGGILLWSRRTLSFGSVKGDECGSMFDGRTD